MGRVFPVFLAAVGGDVEEGVGVAEAFDAAGVGGVGVIEVVAEAEEDAEAVGLAAGEVVFAFGAVLGVGDVVVFAGGDLLVDGDVEVVVEIAAVR